MHIKRFYSLGKGFTEDINISWVVPFCVRLNACLFLKIAIFGMATCSFFQAALAQQIPSQDTILKQAVVQVDTTKRPADSLTLRKITLTTDTLAKDTLPKTVKPKKDVIEAPVMYLWSVLMRFGVVG